MMGNTPKVGKRTTQSPNVVEAKTRIGLHKQRQHAYLYPDLPYTGEYRTIVLEHVINTLYKNIPQFTKPSLVLESKYEVTISTQSPLSQCPTSYRGPFAEKIQ